MTNKTRFMILLVTLEAIRQHFSLELDLERAQVAYDRKNWWMKKCKS